MIRKFAAVVCLCLICLTSSCVYEKSDNNSVTPTENASNSEKALSESKNTSDSNTAESPKAKYMYIANSKTKKFHYSDCSAVRQMDDKNKVYLNISPEDAENNGYIPCERCCP